LIPKRSVSQRAASKPFSLPIHSYSPAIAIFARAPVPGQAKTRLAPLLGREALQASQLEEKITHRVTMRYRGDLNNRMRLTFQGRIFQVQSILSPDEARQALQVMCEEVVLGEAVS